MSTERTAISTSSKPDKPILDRSDELAVTARKDQLVELPTKKPPIPSDTAVQDTEKGAARHTVDGGTKPQHKLQVSLAFDTEKLWHKETSGKVDRTLSQCQNEVDKSGSNIRKNTSDGKWQEIKPDLNKGNLEDQRVFESSGTKITISKLLSLNHLSGTSRWSDSAHYRIRLHRPNSSDDLVLNVKDVKSITTNPDGSFQIIQKNGTTIVGQPDGTIVRDDHQWVKETWKPDGTKFTEKTDTDKDGNTTVTVSTQRPDHTSRVTTKRPDGSIDIRLVDQDGNVRTYSEHPCYKEDSKGGRRLIGHQVVETGPKPEDNRVYDVGEELIKAAQEKQAELEAQYGVTFSKSTDQTPSLCPVKVGKPKIQKESR